MKKFLMVAAIVFMSVGIALAVPIDPSNSRPIGIALPPSGELSVQQILDANWPGVGVNAATDQSSAGMWAVTSALYPSTIPTLIYEGAGNADVNKVGIWSGTDSSGITSVPIFLGLAVAGTTASLSWDDSGLLTISGTAGKINNQSGIVGINPFGFGFYLEGANGALYYTVDQLNGNGAPQALAYNNPNTDTWKICFEDLPYGSSSDFNDFIFRAESMQAVPIPAAVWLLGAGLMGLVGIRKKVRS